MSDPKIDNLELCILLGDAMEQLEKARITLSATDYMEPEEIIKQATHEMEQAELRITHVKKELNKKEDEE